jgi:hypothetical protein
MKMFKNKFLALAFVVTLALVGGLSLKTEALTTSIDINLVGCASGGAYNTITGALCPTSTTMNPPALGVLPVGCDLGVGTVYSPTTGESCSINGVTITPPIAMFYPWDAYGCKAGSPYSMTTGNKCAGATISVSDICAKNSTNPACQVITPLPPVYNCNNSTTDVKCANPIKLPPIDCTVAKNAECANAGMGSTVGPLPPVKVDCMVAKNADCAKANMSSTAGTPAKPVNGVCPTGTDKVYNADTGELMYCKAHLPVFTNLPEKIISSTDDMKALQAALNNALAAKLSVKLTVDGKSGAMTRAAIKMFQAQVGIKADGKVGSITLGKLRASMPAL